MPANLPSSHDWAAQCQEDGEFLLAARHWNGGLRLHIGDQTLTLGVFDGHPSADAPTGNDILEFTGDVALWEGLLAAVPPRFYTDIFAAMSTGNGPEPGGDPVTHAQYYGAAMRAIELLRPDASTEAVLPEAKSGHDSPVGRYVHVDLQGESYRIYYEEAGQGIPVLLQHTAGCHGSQWRHLFEESAITDHFRLIAYDLPFHGKSLPPVGREWWAEKYDLRGDFLRAVPVGLAQTLELDQLVFIGCSVGGLLALDLAHKHPELFRAVVSVEGALNIEGSVSSLTALWHPQVSNEYKARAMEGLTAPMSPKAYVKETSFVYACGWPQAFLGDLYYYIEDFDLRDHADEIDTGQVGVHILSGEYDHSGTSELGRAAHEAIAGSTWAEMKAVGHFPMSENPEAFLRYLLPVLETIRGAAGDSARRSA